MTPNNISIPKAVGELDSILNGEHSECIPEYMSTRDHDKIENQFFKCKGYKLPNFEIEKQFEGQRIIGIDEVGRGPLAGPMVVVAAYIDPKLIPDGVNDSKLLTPKKRKELYDQLRLVAKYGVGFVSPEEIDEFRLTKATEIAINRAMMDIDFEAELALIDGNIKYELPIKSLSIIQGDRKSLTIATASIIAKVIRDEYMALLSKEYPAYLWHKNSGYGTKEHLNAIREFGITSYHRKSFSYT